MNDAIPDKGLLTLDLAKGTWHGSAHLYAGLGLFVGKEKTVRKDLPLTAFYSLIHVKDCEQLKCTLEGHFPPGISEFEETFRILHSATKHEFQTRMEGHVRYDPPSGSIEFFGKLDILPSIPNAGTLLAQYDKLLSYSDDMLALLDHKCHYITVNDHYAGIFDKPREYFRSHSMEELFSHAPSHFQNVIKPMLNKCLAGQKVSFERWVDVPSFGQLFLHISYQPFRNAVGEVCGIVVVGRDRTEITSSIDALKQNETILNRTGQIANLGGWFLDSPSGNIHWTDEMYKIHEVEQDFLLTAENIENFVPEEMLPNVRNYLKKGLQGHPYDMTMPIKTAKGNVKWVRSVAFPVIENGTVVRLEGVLQDITQLTNIQKKLEQSQEKYRSLVEETNALLWDADPETWQFTYISPQVSDLTGYTSKQWSNPQFRQTRIHPEELPQVNMYYTTVISNLQDHVLEYRIIKPNGSELWVQEDVKIIRNELGEPIRIRGVMINITRLKEMQAGLNKALYSLETQKYILDQHAVVSITDKQGILTYVNNKFVELSGYSRDELIGKTHHLLNSGKHSDNFFENLWNIINRGEIWQDEVCYKAKGGNLYWVYSTIVPLMDEQGHTEEFISVLTDITNLKQTEESLRRVQKMEAIGQLTGGVAHDFNNLLGIVIGNLELIEMLIPGNKQLMERLEAAKNAALRGSVLTRRLLNFSHQTPISGKAHNLSEVLKNLEVLISKSLTALVRVDMHLSDELWFVEVEVGDFEDAIINLSINASDAMPSGGQLTFSSRNMVVKDQLLTNNILLPPGEYVEITIEDTGVGMPENDIENIFEPYFSTKPSDKGSGLGLSMVYGFVKRSNGLICVNSTINEGTCFSIYFPKSEHTDDIRFEEKLQDDSLETISATNSETILLVDDEVDIVTVTSKNLENAGYHIISCNSPEEALEILKSNESIDLLFTDVVIPGKMNGFELAKEAEKFRPGLKILFTTGYVKIQNQEMKKNWRDSLIQKPYRSVELTKKIRNIMDNNPGK